MFCHYFILLFVVAYCNQDGEWFNCKPKPGCSIAQCDPRPASQWFGNDGLNDEYPILCQQNEASSSATASTEIANQFDEIQIKLTKLEGRLERSEKVEFQMNFEITLLEKKNAETEIEIDRLKKEVEEGKRKLNGATKQITSLEKTDSAMRNEIDSAKKEAEESKGKLNAARKQIAFLEKKKVEMERKIHKLEIDANGSKRRMKNAITQIDLLKKENTEMEIRIRKMEKNEHPCTNGMIYDNKCFIAVVDRIVNYDDGVAKCESRGGHLANIYSQTHMYDVMKYIRENRMGASSLRGFRLGVKYDPKADKLTLRDGTDAPAGLKWYPGRPVTVEAYGEGVAGYTNVILQVSSDQSSTDQYLVNDPPSSIRYVLCEIE